MYLECFGLKEQLLDTVNDLESTIKQILEALYIDKKQTDRELQENMASLVEQFNGKQLEFVDLLNRVADHQEREQYIRTLEESVENRDNLISRMASELKVIESSLVEATYQAEKKCRSVKQSESNRIFSEDAIKFAHLISKHHSVASSVFWQQGDAARPFPTEAHFNVSNLLLSRTQPQQAPAFIMHGQMSGKAAMFNVPGMPPGAQRMFTPSQRPVFPPNMVPPSSTGTGSPRGRPPGTGGGARMSSPSPRSFPKILQRNQSPRFPLLMPGSLVSPSGSSPIVQSQQQQPGFLSPNSLQMMAQQHSQQQQMMATAGKQSTPNAAADIPRVEQMSSSSSSSSSEDEASPDGR